MAKRSKPEATEVKFSNLDKILFPEAKFTKGEMIRYYVDAAPYLLPHLKDRPVTLIRFPDGVQGESFYEKNAPHFAPSWIETFPVPRQHHEGTINYILINDARTLAWCANLAAIELHPFLHRAQSLDTPTHIAFDLDPGEGADLLTCAEVAFLVKEVLDGLGLEAFPKVSGSKGVQLYVPLNGRATYAITQPFAKAVAELLEQQHPKKVVSNMSKALRKNRVLIDWSQNTRAKTTVCVYSLRGKRQSPFVSMPVTWKELQTALKKKDASALVFTPDAALKRMKKLGDLFAPVLKLKQKLPGRFVESAKDSAPKTTRAAKTKSTATAALRAYEKKRDFSKTAEPTAKSSSPAKAEGPRRFVIQKHAASRLHFDFRLEMDGTLKSWAVPKGLPYEPGVRRAAFEVEDHPLDYMQFEGTIPKGQYGGGTVMVWDIGTYELLKGSHAGGDLKLVLHGKKLKGEWHLFHIRSEDDKPVWLIVKAGKAMKPLSARAEDSSILTRRSMARIAKDNDAQWQSHR
ncbi:MAG TPA: non-homologous end-joining DNA ligase [Opitutaceae bacterium]|nr:non-homologous end-joining DNA ligase [Opitutaceae bacterium]